MDDKKISEIIKNRKKNRIILFFEGIYAVILLFSVLFNFPAFVLELKIQFVLIAAFYFVGWIVSKVHRKDS